MTRLNKVLANNGSFASLGCGSAYAACKCADWGSHRISKYFVRGEKNLNTKRKAVVSASQSAEAVLTGRFYMSVQFSSLLLFG